MPQLPTRIDGQHNADAPNHEAALHRAQALMDEDRLIEAYREVDTLLRLTISQSVRQGGRQLLSDIAQRKKDPGAVTIAVNMDVPMPSDEQPDVVADVLPPASEPEQSGLFSALQLLTRERLPGFISPALQDFCGSITEEDLLQSDGSSLFDALESVPDMHRRYVGDLLLLILWGRGFIHTEVWEHWRECLRTGGRPDSVVLPERTEVLVLSEDDCA